MNKEYKTASLKEIINAFERFDTFYISGHKNPDGDSVGSCDCLKLALESIGKKVQCNNAQCFIQVDVQPEYRLPKESLEIKNNAEFSICIDHHQEEELCCNLTYVDSSASANALNIWDLVNLMDIKINCEIASAAYYGLCSDTNSFTNTNTDERSFKAATNMMSYGVDASAIAQKLFQSRSIASFELEKTAIENMYVDEENRFACSFLSAKDYAKYNATKEDSDAAINKMRELGCVDVVCIIRQEKPGEKIHGSLRSKTDIDVSILAKKHIGGGHRAASGFTMQSCDLNSS